VLSGAQRSDLGGSLHTPLLGPDQKCDVESKRRAERESHLPHCLPQYQGGGSGEKDSCNQEIEEPTPVALASEVARSPSPGARAGTASPPPRKRRRSDCVEAFLKAVSRRYGCPPAGPKDRGQEHSHP
jgi:hypothetical protein